MIHEITNVDEVSVFFRELLREGVNAHPDEDFVQYINYETGKPTYTPEDASYRNGLMNKSVDVCEQNSIDIYDLMQEIYLEETGLNQFIPLPSQKEFD